MDRPNARRTDLPEASQTRSKRNSRIWQMAPVINSTMPAFFQMGQATSKPHFFLNLKVIRGGVAKSPELSTVCIRTCKPVLALPVKTKATFHGPRSGLSLSTRRYEAAAFHIP